MAEVKFSRCIDPVTLPHGNAYFAPAVPLKYVPMLTTPGPSAYCCGPSTSPVLAVC